MQVIVKRKVRTVSGQNTMERDERIRHAYWVEGKGIKQIARELHHSHHTVRKALAAGGAQVKGSGVRNHRRPQRRRDL